MVKSSRAHFKDIVIYVFKMGPRRFDPTVGKEKQAQRCVKWYPFSNLYDAAAEVWEWVSNFIPHFTGYVAKTEF